MIFSKRLKECREAQDLSQAALAKNVGVHKSLIGKYERNEVKPNIDIVLNLAQELNTTVGYLIGEFNDQEVVKDNSMLHRILAIGELPSEDKKHILYLIDGLVRDAKARKAYS